MRRLAALEPQVPVAQNGRELIAQDLQLANFLIEQLELLPRCRPHLPARRTARAPLGEKVRDLGKREADADRIADHADTCNRGLLKAAAAVTVALRRGDRAASERNEIGRAHV